MLAFASPTLAFASPTLPFVLWFTKCNGNSILAFASPTLAFASPMFAFFVLLVITSQICFQNKEGYNKKVNASPPLAFVLVSTGAKQAEDLQTQA